jgi:CheY-like chemotaxis protein
VKVEAWQSGSIVLQRSEPWAEPQPGPPCILVVEDEPLIRSAIAEALRDLGISVIEAATADEAWEYLTTCAPVDLVFTDHRMPGSKSGAQLATNIRQRYPQLKIVITSAVFDTREWSGPFFSKPYPLFETAVELVELALENRRRREDR